jgi:hypothetical protein
VLLFSLVGPLVVACFCFFFRLFCMYICAYLRGRWHFREVLLAHSNAIFAVTSLLERSTRAIFCLQTQRRTPSHLRLSAFPRVYAVCVVSCVCMCVVWWVIVVKCPRPCLLWLLVGVLVFFMCAQSVLGCSGSLITFHALLYFILPFDIFALGAWEKICVFFKSLMFLSIELI